MKKVVITSGYYNPIHIGHVNLMRDAKKLGDFLVVIVNNDEQVKIKGSVPFMPEAERVEIVKNLKYVDEVILSIDLDSGRQDKSLAFLADKYKGSEIIFAKGGDSTMENVETDTCKKLGIRIVLDVGGGKVQSSSWLLGGIAKTK
jgi:cytidyltransferase-like protein